MPIQQVTGAQVFQGDVGDVGEGGGDTVRLSRSKTSKHASRERNDPIRIRMPSLRSRTRRFKVGRLFVLMNQTSQKSGYRC